jgi:2-dehydropantoate 2-reductase
MRIAVMGTGAVGGYFGAKLAAAGHSLSFIARGKQLEAMQRSGLTIESTQGDHHVKDAVFTGDAAQVGNVDLVLFCVKSYDTTASAEHIGPLVGPETQVLSLQNGVDNADKISRLWGNNRTLGGVVYIGAAITQPAVVQHSSAGRIILGTLDGAGLEPARRVHQALAGAGVPCEISTEIRKAQWRKLLWNAPFCAISCLTRTNVREIVESDSLRSLALDCMQEVIAAGNTQGISLEARLKEESVGFSRSMGDFKPSMLQDLEAGKPLEYEAFNGLVVELLHRAGKQAPINQVFYRALGYIDKKIRSGEGVR